ncbi:MAG: phage tail tape measure protein [Pseudomonadota bacterium]
MTDRNDISFHLAASAEDARIAGEELKRVAEEEILPAAALIEDAFQSVGSTIQSSLRSAADSGELSMKRLARAIVQNLRALAIDSLVREPVRNLVANALSASVGGGLNTAAHTAAGPITGGRALGGPVAPGGAYLVGERGPEIFSPHGAGVVAPMARSGAGVTVNITLPGVTDAESFRRSETQVSAALARAIGRGRRNL